MRLCACPLLAGEPFRAIIQSQFITKHGEFVT